MRKFTDTMHESTEDGFVIETDYKNRKFVRIQQEAMNDELIEVFLSVGDIEQIYNAIKNEKHKSIGKEITQRLRTSP